MPQWWRWQWSVAQAQRLQTERMCFWFKQIVQRCNHCRGLEEKLLAASYTEILQMFRTTFALKCPVFFINRPVLRRQLHWLCHKCSDQWRHRVRGVYKWHRSARCTCTETICARCLCSDCAFGAVCWCLCCPCTFVHNSCIFMRYFYYFNNTGVKIWQVSELLLFIIHYCLLLILPFGWQGYRACKALLWASLWGTAKLGMTVE